MRSALKEGKYAVRAFELDSDVLLWLDSSGVGSQIPGVPWEPRHTPAELGGLVLFCGGGVADNNVLQST